MGKEKDKKRKEKKEGKKTEQQKKRLAPPKPPGFHTTAREPKRAHLTAPALQTPKLHEKTPREGRKEEHGGGKGKQQAMRIPPAPLTIRGPYFPHFVYFLFF